MQVQVIDARDAVVVAPLLADAIRTGHHQPMQHGEEHRALDRKLEAAPGEQLVHHRSALGVAPQPLEQQRRTDPFTGQLRDAAFVQQRQHHRSLRQAGDGADQPVEIAAPFDVFLAAQRVDDALPGLAVLAHALDEIEVAVGTDALFPDEHALSIAESSDSSTKKPCIRLTFSTTLLNFRPRHQKTSREINGLYDRFRYDPDWTVKDGPGRKGSFGGPRRRWHIRAEKREG